MQLSRKRCSGWPTLLSLAKIVVLALLVFPAQAAAFWPFGQNKPQKAPVEAVVAPVALVAAPAASQAQPVSEAAALRSEIQGLANELSRNLADADPENGDLGKGLLICTFVELNKLSRTSSLGRYVAEQLMNEMQRRRYEVVEIRKSQAVMLQEKRGEFGLSRDPAEISQTVSAGAMLTGTYISSKDSIVINARIIDNQSARLLSSATAIIPRNKLAEQLLADTASVREAKPEPLYLKKLEL